MAPRTANGRRHLLIAAASSITVTAVGLGWWVTREGDADPHEMPVAVVLSSQAEPAFAPMASAPVTLRGEPERAPDVASMSLIERQLLVRSRTQDTAAAAAFKEKLQRRLAVISPALTVDSVVIAGSIGEVMGSMAIADPDDERRSLAFLTGTSIRDVATSLGMVAPVPTIINKPSDSKLEFIIHGTWMAGRR